MQILKNKCLVLLITMITVPSFYFLCLPSSDVITGLFLLAMALIVWAANEAAESNPYEKEWIDPDWIPGRERQEPLPTLLWAQ